MAKKAGNKVKKSKKKATNVKRTVVNKGRKYKSLEIKLEEIQSDCTSIRDRFELGKVDKLKDLQYHISDAMAQEIGINHSRLIAKLYNPITLTVKDIFRFSYYVNFDPELMVIQAAKEIKEDKELEKSLKKFRSIRVMKQYNKEIGKKGSGKDNIKKTK